jgi:tRNA pseudouridine32 synthase / 23S rRNA pseudouridine746 synthase
MSTSLQRVYDTFTSRRHQFLIYLDDCPYKDPPLLSELLTRYLPHINPLSWPDRIEFGGVHRNGIRVQQDVPITLPCKLEYFEPVYSFNDYASQFPQWSTDWICHEDDDIIVVAKPAGLPTFPCREQTLFSLRAYLDNYLPSPPHLPSRIDTSTMGLVIASKSERMHAPLQQLFERRRIEKQYVLGVAEAPLWEGLSIHTRITKDPQHPVLRTTSFTEGKTAQTTLFPLISDESGALLLALPHTGRTHQIRVHLASMGMPLNGDNFYGGQPSPQLQLACYRLRFSDSRTGDILTFTLPNHLCPVWLKKAQTILEAW